MNGRIAVLFMDEFFSVFSFVIAAFFSLQHAHDKVSVDDSLDGDQFVGQFLQFCCFAFQGYRFHAVVVIEMDVLAADDEMMVIMLDAGQFLLQIGLVMIVYKNQAAAYFAVAFPLFFFKMLPDKETYCLGSVRECMSGNQFVELCQKIIFKRYAKSLHGSARIDDC